MLHDVGLALAQYIYINVTIKDINIRTYLDIKISSHPAETNHVYKYAGLCISQIFNGNYIGSVIGRDFTTKVSNNPSFFILSTSLSGIPITT